MMAANKQDVALWGGIEGTINRVGNAYFDQCERSGHAARKDDLDLFADLGIRTIRYPALWERVAPQEPQRYDWTLTDERLGHLRDLGMTPIVGLIHHGSGPRYTGLADPEFPEKFTAYALAFARRYPWVELYTPVNEPLTTARFSGLYGFWYPHARDDLLFSRMLLNELRATVLAMRAIRTVNSRARLVQTEDLGKATATPPLAYQAEFENHRRWLTFDLLLGHVDRRHPMRAYFLKSGVSPDELVWFLDNPCPPDILGINHYLLSNRFLDHRLNLYPETLHGTNGVDRYADVGAVDSAAATLPKPKDVLGEVWRRYKLPFAVTEVHLNDHRENQMRWFLEVWHAAQDLRREGCDLRAVTAWSLLGSFDWNSLCTVCAGHYEPGVFDVRAPRPRGTGLAKMIRTLSRHRRFDHPVLAQSGWWHDPSRRLYAQEALVSKRDLAPIMAKSSRPLIITGATGTLGRAFATICERRGLPHHLIGRSRMDIADEVLVRAAIAELKPWAVINTAGYVKVDEAEREQDRCYRENVLGAEILAKVCAERKIPIVTFSSDLVFDGSLSSPYLESHGVAPLSVYGKSKAEAEKRVLGCHEKALVIRSSAFFGPWDECNFVYLTLRRLAQGQEVAAIENVTITPTYVPDLVHACLDLLIDGEKGVWHLTNQGEVTWLGLARMAAKLARQDVSRIVGRKCHDCGIRAPRPAYSALGSERARILPPVDQALERFFSELTISLRRTE